MHLKTLIGILIAALPVGQVAAAATTGCPANDGVVLQVLGSGGPIADDGRAGSAYVVWVDGHSRVLIDAGSGMFVRFAESGASFGDLDFVGLSHFHVDHTAGFPALLKSGSFSARSRELIVAGPGGSALFPGLGAFMARLLDPDNGLFAYLGGYLDGRGHVPKLALFEIRDRNTEPVVVVAGEDSDYEVSALRVSHGIVPAVAYRVRIGDRVLVFAGDQDGTSTDLAAFAAEADVLVLHMPIPEGSTGVARRLHAPPSALGQLAADAGAKSVLVSHLMRRSIVNIDANISALKSRYNGDVRIASDLGCYTIGQE